MGESPVGFGHLVHGLAFLHGAALLGVGVEDLAAALRAEAADTARDNFADVASQVAGLVAETTGFTAAAGTATAVAAAVTPPGNDADSVLAVAQNNAATADFVAALSAGIEQLGERAAETTMENATFQALSAAGGAAVSAL